MYNQWLLISVLAVTTYLSRITDLLFMAGKKLNPVLRQYFNFVPVAIIVALLVKQTLIPSEGHLILSVPVLIACLTGAIAIKLMKRFLPSVALGMIAGLIWRYFFSCLPPFKWNHCDQYNLLTHTFFATIIKGGVFRWR